jgi:hypothetical protein
MPQKMGTRIGTQPPANAQNLKDSLIKVNAGHLNAWQPEGGQAKGDR